MYNYALNSHVLDTVTSYEYLGVTIANDLRWNTRIHKISQKTLKASWYLRRNLTSTTTEVKLTVYKTYIWPILECADVIWDPFMNTNIEQLERVQKCVSDLHTGSTA